jgi:hypothetical protein
MDKCPPNSPEERLFDSGLVRKKRPENGFLNPFLPIDLCEERRMVKL